MIVWKQQETDLPQILLCVPKCLQSLDLEHDLLWAGVWVGNRPQVDLYMNLTDSLDSYPQRPLFKYIQWVVSFDPFVFKGMILSKNDKTWRGRSANNCQNQKSTMQNLGWQQRIWTLERADWCSSLANYPLNFSILLLDLKNNFKKYMKRVIFLKKQKLVCKWVDDYYLNCAIEKSGTSGYKIKHTAFLGQGMVAYSCSPSP